MSSHGDITSGSDDVAGSDYEDPEEQSCRRAALAAERVVRDECSGRIAEVRELTDETTVYVPEAASTATTSASADQVSEQRVRDLIDDDEWLEAWVSQMCDLAGVEEGTAQRDTCERRFARSLLR